MISAREEDSESLVTSIYEAAALPELWPSVLQRIAAQVDAADASFLAMLSCRWSGSWLGMVGSPAFPYDDYVIKKVSERSQLPERLLAWEGAGFASTSEGFTEDEWQRDPYYLDVSKPNRLGHAAATAIRNPSGEVIVVHLDSYASRWDFTRDEIERLNALRPHLARATLLATRWRLERLKSVAEALEALHLPALILDGAGRVLAANKLIEPLTGYINWLARDRIALIDSAANRLLTAAIAELHDVQSTAVRSFAARSAAGEDRVVGHLIPTPGLARDMFGGGSGILILTPITAPEPPDVALIRGLFDLTPREAVVARAIAQGLTVDDIAGRDGVSPETVRTQVKAVLGKTGTGRQVEAAVLLGGVQRLKFS